MLPACNTPCKIEKFRANFNRIVPYTAPPPNASIHAYVSDKDIADDKGVHRLIESQSGRQILVLGSRGCTWYSFQSKAHIMRTEKIIIWHSISQKARNKREMTSCLDASCQRVHAIGNIRTCPKFRPMNNVTLQSGKL